MANTERPEEATPLPWEVRETESGDPYIASGVFILIDRFYVTRETYSERERAEERRANAELIVRSVNQSPAFAALYRALIAFVPLCAKCTNRAAWIGSMSGVRLCDEHKRDSSYIDDAVLNAIAALALVEKGEAYCE